MEVEEHVGKNSRTCKKAIPGQMTQNERKGKGKLRDQKERNKKKSEMDTDDTKCTQSENV